MLKIDAIFGIEAAVPLFEGRVSGHGRFQRLVLACAHLATAVMSFYDMYLRLLAADIDHWCKPPPGAEVDEWKSANIPLVRNGGYSRCFKYEDTAVTTAFRPMLPRNASREVAACTEWQYDLPQGVHSAVSEWDLVCQSAWQVHLITIYYNLGCCVTAPLLGQISDRHGRKHVITASLLVALISSAAGTMTSSFLVFLLARIFLGASVSMLHVNFVVLLFETTSPEYRSLYFLAAHFGYIEGSAVVTLLEASSLDHHVVGALGLILTCILSLSQCIVIESPRWLLATLNMNEFYRVEKRLAEAKSVVDVTPDPNEGSHTTDERHGLPQWKKKSTTDPLDQSVVNLFSNRAVRHRTAYVWGLWFLAWFSVHGLWNIAPRPPSFRLALLAVIPRVTIGMLAYAIIERYTRKGALGTLLSGSVAAAFAACLFASFLQDLSLSAHQLPQTLAFAVDAVVELHTLELVPTVMRAMGLCMAVLFGRLGITLSITLKSLADYTHACGALVLVVCCAVFIGLLMRWMQETKGVKPAESVYDVEVDDMKHDIMKIFQDDHRRR
ncbi:organic anion transporter 3-like [Haemaphysalis longicornis]